MRSDGAERVEWIQHALHDAELDALLCTIPENVLLLSGYRPVVGTSLAIATRAGRVAVLAPKDEVELAEHGWAHEVRTYSSGAFETWAGPIDTVVSPLEALLRDLGVDGGVIGIEERSVFQGATYAASFLFPLGIREVTSRAARTASIRSGAETILHLRARQTAYEVGRVRLACRLAGQGFDAAVATVRPGAREPQIATAFASAIEARSLGHQEVQRADAFVWCMSGERSALAGAAYARTRNRELRPGDLVLVHCNSHIDGYWTDITRTYCLGEPEDRQRAMYDAVYAAREAALATIRPGVHAAEVDRAARAILEDRDFGRYFTHGVGHSVGFSVISADFPPRLHPASPDVLEAGMTFNIEPSIYIPDFGGIRHCDVVTVHEDGPEVLTPFQVGVEHVVIP